MLCSQYLKKYLILFHYQTADFEFYLRNVVAYLSRSGVVDKVAATADLSFYSPPFPFLNGSDVNLNDNINLYKPYYPLPTIDGK